MMASACLDMNDNLTWEMSMPAWPIHVHNDPNMQFCIGVTETADAREVRSTPVMSARAQPISCFMKKRGDQARFIASCTAYRARGQKPPPGSKTMLFSIQSSKDDL
jgi:hypothetical protein